MSKLRDAAQQALEALESCREGDYTTGHVIHPSFDEKAVAEAEAALRAALAEQPAEQQPQGPVAWRDVAGFDYKVSSNGDLRSKKTGRIIMAKSLTGAGYVKAALWDNGQRKQTTVHRLVAEAFLGPAEGREVNHKNGNKQDNRVSNLEWCSRSDKSQPAKSGATHRPTKQ